MFSLSLSVIQMFLRNDTKIIDPPYELHLPGCPEPCTLDDWLSITSQVVPEDWAAECNADEDVVEMATETLVGRFVRPFVSASSTGNEWETPGTDTVACSRL